MAGASRGLMPAASGCRQPPVVRRDCQRLARNAYNREMKLTRKVIFASIVPALALSMPGLRADVTLRYETEFKPAPALQAMMDQLVKTMQSGAGAGTTILMKGNQGYTTAGNWSEIFDFTKGDVTVINPRNKTFAAFPLSQLGDKMAAAMPQTTPQGMQAVQQILASMKTSVDSKMTGKTAEIQGVQAEERQITFTIDFPLPAGMANQAGPSMNMKLVMHIWTAKKEEALRVPAIRELIGYQAWQRYIVNPVGIFEKVAATMPGLSNAIGPLIAELSKNQSVMLRTNTEIYMPFLAGVAKQMAAQGQSSPAIDPDAPLVQINREVAELSTAPVDASLFEVPKDYTSVSADEMFHEICKTQCATAAVAPK